MDANPLGSTPTDLLFGFDCTQFILGKLNQDFLESNDFRIENLN